MNVTIKGKHLTAEKRALVADLAQWCTIKLLGPRLSKNIQLSIHTVGPTIYNRDRLYGTTEVDEDDERSRPRSFKIIITSRFEILRTLMIVAHEMVHVKQYARGELGYCSRSGKSKWQGTKICEDATEYWDLPWEIEAHGREKGLVYMWARERGHDGQPWFKELF
jgi:hypothetical protein